MIGIDQSREIVELSLRAWLPGVATGDVVEGRIERVLAWNVLVRLPSGAIGGIALPALPPHIAEAPARHLLPGVPIRVRVLWINPAERRIGLSARDVGEDYRFGVPQDPESPLGVLRELTERDQG